MKKFLMPLIPLLAVGCASQKYGFRPTSNATTVEAGYPAAHYPVPPGSPRGEVYVTSFGTREVDAGGGARAQLIHIRMAVADNNADTDWVVDPAQQLLAPPGGTAQPPDFMEIDGKHDVNTTVTRGQRRVFDLYYRMPGGAADARNLPGFELQWQLSGGGQVFTERTAFTRDRFRDYEEGQSTRVAVVASPWWAYGYGPGWWGGFGFGYAGPWGYPYYGYGYGPFVGVGVGFGGYRGGYHSYYGGGGPRYGGGGFSRGGGGGGSIRGPVSRGRH